MGDGVGPSGSIGAQDDAGTQMMENGSRTWLSGRRMPPFARDALDALVRCRAERLLELALRAEADDYVERHRDLRDAAGKALVVRNGLATERHVVTMAGTLAIRAPRVLDRRPGESFVSAILPPYARTSQRLAAALPELALRGLGAGSISSGDAVLRALIGPAASGLSGGIARRLDTSWTAECRAWLDRRLDGMRFAEVWAGPVGEGGTLSHRAGCLALIGMTEDGATEILAVGRGFADDDAWWRATLLALARRGLGWPMMVTGDYDLGIWRALDEVYPSTLQLPYRWHLVLDRTAGWQPSELCARRGGGFSRKHANASVATLEGAVAGTGNDRTSSSMAGFTVATRILASNGTLNAEHGRMTCAFRLLSARRPPLAWPAQLSIAYAAVPRASAPGRSAKDRHRRGDLCVASGRLRPMTRRGTALDAAGHRANNITRMADAT